MRTLTLLLVTSMMAAPAAAQTAQLPGVLQRRSMIVDGTGSIQHREDDDGGWQTSVSLQPQLLYFVADRIAIGGLIGYSFFKFDGGDGSGWAIGPAARIYLPARWTRVLPYVAGTVLHNTSRFASSGITSKTSSDVLEAAAGATILLSETVGISTEGYYASDAADIERTSLPNQEIRDKRYGLRARVTAFLPR